MEFNSVFFCEIFVLYKQKGSQFIHRLTELNTYIIPIESKYRMTIGSDTLQNLSKFVEDKKCPFGIVVTKDEFGLADKIIKIPLWVFLLIP